MTENLAQARASRAGNGGVHVRERVIRVAPVAVRALPVPREVEGHDMMR
eukprot:CAMPEP_0206226004 /NCGR_PEP_ID=MMETSP0047_2-20121206/7844_1 /ASSEMBLY_ACC=CAM_ASM_000192 /TAXON_ID=195065 /ORGANISM="Chroomonas mesostigmatica_cf, Strain CCMP1168" /LENGTH=48 /DNA_ID= /DNA_START= /DNA_END= /DNA_ORIENTATION=